MSRTNYEIIAAVLRGKKQLGCDKKLFPAGPGYLEIGSFYVVQKGRLIIWKLRCCERVGRVIRGTGLC